ncbi:hypothetical protein PAV_5c00070 [Paenibacillus alvei DSM 29]|nr:hypothetical protein PAV_21c00070 [Paenibacillus alvei DSM 29]EJW16428.1 hypothetical protein PAV_5c00070 [Paenibacillus alvei DSM 29]
MRLAVRISYSEDLDAQRCLTAAGGNMVLPAGKPPQFHFPTKEHYSEYCKLLRESKVQK